MPTLPTGTVGIVTAEADWCVTREIAQKRMREAKVSLKKVRERLDRHKAIADTAAIGTFAWVRYSSRAPHDKSDAGLWLMVLNSAGIALLETWATDPNMQMVGHLSWTAIVILLSAMIVPSTPSRMLVAALVSASLGPLGVWLAHLRGVDTPSLVNTFVLYMPNYSCAMAAVVPSHMFQKMGRRLKEARDLGSYELVERLGEGGMGEVWRARHRLLARPAAIKLVRPAML